MMQMCRACLSTGTGMIPMNETFINNYNVFTNLDIKLTEDTSLYICKTCFDGALFCIEFRKKCIASDQTLKDLLLSKNDLRKCKEVKEEETVTVKKEIKLEYSDDDDDDDMFDGFDDFDDEEYLIDLKNEKDASKLTSVQAKSDTKEPLTKRKTPLTKTKSKGKRALSPDPDVECGLCTKSFKDKSSLIVHLETHKSKITCGLCSEHFISWPHLLSHRIEHISGEKRCHICSKKYNTATNLEFHYMKVHELAEKDEKIKCKKCPLSYTTGRKLLKHMGHSHAELKYTCETCGKGYTSSALLAKHVIVHANKRPYKCELCDYSSNFCSGLRAHKIARHTEGRVYCKLCSRVFQCQDLLDLHKCKEKSKVICTICGITLRNFKGAMLRHMRSHNESGHYKCTKCPAGFKSRSNLDIHMDKHAGTPRHKCEYCERIFYSPSVLIKHRRTHTGEKPYVCKICNRGFTGNHNLKVHMKVHGLNMIKSKNVTEDTELDNF